MSRRKRARRRIEAAEGEATRQRPRPARAEPAVRVQPVRRRRWLGISAALAGLVLLLCAGGGWWMKRSARAELPKLDLTQVEPAVAKVIRQQLDAVRLTPDSGEAWGWLGALLRAYDFRPEARIGLTEAARLDASNPRWPYHHGLLLMITAPGEAVEYLRRAATLCGNTPEAPRLRLGRLLGELGRWDEAEHELNGLVAGRPDYAPAWLTLAQGAQARGETAAAITLAQRCTEDPRTRRAAWAMLSALHRQAGDLPAATKAAQRSAAAPPDEGFSDPFEVELATRRADPRVLSEQCHTLLAARRIAEADPLIDRLVAEHAYYPETWLLDGRRRLLKKDLSGAELALRRHLQLTPNSTQGLYQLGLVLLEKKQFADAAECFRKTTELKPDHGPAFYNYGYALALSGRKREAVPAFRATLRHNPEHFESYLLLADLYLQLGESEEAAKLLPTARQIRPDDPRLPQVEAKMKQR